MHDVPYVQNQHVGYEVIASMTRLATEIKQILPKMPCGVQVLASANCQALAIAKAANLQFIRAEGFVFSHVADEGFTNSCAGELLRYRKHISAENVLVFTDLKKKHSSHAITSDVSLLETVHAAEFFLTDGVILTGMHTIARFMRIFRIIMINLFDFAGTATGQAVSVNDLKSIQNKCQSPILIGSGVTTANLKDYFYKSNAAIIGSYFKQNGNWSGDLCEKRIASMIDAVQSLRESSWLFSYYYTECILSAIFPPIFIHWTNELK